MSDHAKITDAHRRRRAVVYVRQSTPQQLERNHESRARQYALRERAIELGWPAGAVDVVDGDLGRSGASSEGRLGFKELVAEVGLGHVGLVLALEVSRLARSSADWHQLLDLCALTTTLIADSDGIYSPQDFNDRLLLGLKGTMSEAELHLIRSRLDGGLRNKAKRGELEQNLPVGLDRDEDGRIMLSADEQVRHAIERVFELWRRLGSARQVVRELIAAEQQLPRRTVGSRRVRWARASYGAVHDLLTNPAYAGAFVFGRTRTDKRLDEHGQVRRRTITLPLEQWSVCIPEHHPGYVSWDEYLATRERLPRQRDPRWRGRRRSARGRRAAAGHRALRALRPADAGRLLRPRRPRRALRVRACPPPARHRSLLPVGRRRQAGDARSLTRFWMPSRPRGCAPRRKRSRSSSASTTSTLPANDSPLSEPSSRSTGRAASSMPASPSIASSRAPWRRAWRPRSASLSASAAGSPRWSAAAPSR